MVKIQSYQRTRQAIALVKLLRDPYGHLGIDELNTVYDSESKRLEKAVQMKDFKAAVESERNM